MEVHRIPNLEDLRPGPSVRHLSLLRINRQTDLTVLDVGPNVSDVYLYSHDLSLPKGLNSLATRPGLRMSLSYVDVARWLCDPDFTPPKVKHLTLDRCRIPDDPQALAFPGVTVVVK